MKGRGQKRLVTHLHTTYAEEQDAKWETVSVTSDVKMFGAKTNLHVLFWYSQFSIGSQTYNIKHIMWSEKNKEDTGEMHATCVVIDCFKKPNAKDFLIVCDTFAVMDFQDVPTVCFFNTSLSYN